MTDEWIREHAFGILVMMEQMIGRDGRDVRRLPHRLYWLLWELACIDQGWPSKRLTIPHSP